MTTIRACVVAMCLAATLWPNEANAQRRYQPPRPTFSPYHDLFKRDNGLFDSYNMQLAPRRRAAQEFNQMQGLVTQQQEEINGLNQQVEGLNQQMLRLGGTSASATGKGGGFMTHRRYFGAGSSGSRRGSNARR